MDQLQQALDYEKKSKDEISARRKKQELLNNDLQMEIDELKRANTNLTDSVKKNSQKLSELQIQSELSEQLLAEKTEQAALAERRLNSLNAEMKEMAMSYQTAEKLRKDLASEMRVSQNTIVDLNSQLSSFANEKKKFNETMNSLATDLANEQDDHRVTEDKLKQANSALIDLNSKLMQQKVSGF